MFLEQRPRWFRNASSVFTHALSAPLASSAHVFCPREMIAFRRMGFVNNSKFSNRSN